MTEDSTQSVSRGNQCPVSHGWLFLSGVCLGLLIALLYYQVVVL